MSNLALLGGKPVRTKLFPAYNVIGQDEMNNVLEVMKTGVLSKFLGTWHRDFYGGPQIQSFEQEWAEIFESKHAIAVNSATSGLYCAVGAVGIEPGDEVIVPSLSMSATATAPVIYGGVPVFCDIDPRTLNPDPDSIRRCISHRTKAIIVVHLLGHPTDMKSVMKIADQHKLMVIEDCAQAPFAKYKQHLVGNFGHIGVFSLNYHKHIHTGEGGVCVTNTDSLAERMQLIRNHAEAVVSKKNTQDLTNLVGFNFRMGEIEASMGRSLLTKLKRLIHQRQENVAYLEKKIGDIPGFVPLKPLSDCTHSYYAHAFHYDESLYDVPRELFLKALSKELPATEMRDDVDGPLIGPSYTEPLYMLPMFQNKIAFGSKGYPFIGDHYDGDVSYKKGLCPNAEKACKEIVEHELMRPSMQQTDLDDVVMAFHKVFENIEELRLLKVSRNRGSV